MKLPLVEFESKNFTSVGERKGKREWVIEASDMGDRHLQRLYDDAIDEGFAMKSSTTGAVVVYVMSQVSMDNDEVVAWEFTPTMESIRKYPECENTLVTVFND